jgi:hypothetical protein
LDRYHVPCSPALLDNSANNSADTPNTGFFATPMFKNVDIPSVDTTHNHIDSLLSPLCLKVTMPSSCVYCEHSKDNKENTAPLCSEPETIPHKYQKHQTKFEVIQDVLKIPAEARILEISQLQSTTFKPSKNKLLVLCTPTIKAQHINQLIHEL